MTWRTWTRVGVGHVLIGARTVRPERAGRGARRGLTIHPAGVRWFRSPSSYVSGSRENPRIVFRSNARRESLVSDQDQARPGDRAGWPPSRARGLGRALHPRIAADFDDPSQEWRRLFSELLGTFFLVLVAAGGGMMGQAFPDTISRTAAVVAPALDGAWRSSCSWARSRARTSTPRSASRSRSGATSPGSGFPATSSCNSPAPRSPPGSCKPSSTSPRPTAPTTPPSGSPDRDAFFMETVLTFGLVSVILGTASGAQNLGVFGALGVGGYIALAGLWGSPISGASMNPARTFGPEPRRRRLHATTGCTSPDPLAGAVARRRRRVHPPRRGRRTSRLRSRTRRTLHRSHPSRPSLNRGGSRVSVT